MNDDGSKQKLLTRSTSLAHISFAAILVCILFVTPHAAYTAAPTISRLSPTSGFLNSSLIITGLEQSK
jgi:hypothetical protein